MGRRILVMGATGALGHSVVREAAAAGHEVRALMRRSREDLFEDLAVTAVRGDAERREDIARAAEGCDAVAYCINVPLRDWEEKLVPLLENAIDVCAASGARLIFPGNVWIYGPGEAGDLVDETRASSPTSRKGRLRAELERRLAEGAAPYTIVRLPEFYGPNVANALMGAPFRDAATARAITWLGGDLDVTAEFVFMPDGARAMLEAGLAEDTAGETFHVPGARPITPRELFGILSEAAAGVRTNVMPRWVVRIAGVLKPEAREFVDIFHLWTDPILLDGSKYRARFGAIPQTPYEEGVRRTLDWFRAHPDAANTN